MWSLTTKRSFCRHPGAARESIGRGACFSDKDQPAISAGHRLRFHRSAKHHRGVLNRTQFGRIDSTPLQDGEAIGRDERQKQFRDGRGRSDGARGAARKSFSQVAAARGILRTLGDDGAGQVERFQRRFQKPGLFGRGFEKRHRDADRECHRYRRKAGSRADIHVGFTYERHDGEAIEQVRGQLRCGRRPREIEAASRVEDDGAVPRQRRYEFGRNAGGLKDRRDFIGPIRDQATTPPSCCWTRLRR